MIQRIKSDPINANSTANMKIIAVGNSLYGDDGVGEAVLHALQDLPEFDNVELIDGATDALGLIDHFAGTDHVILIDAAYMDTPPGTVKLFGYEQANLIIRNDHLSLHGISLPETFEIARLAESLPAKLTIVGIEPAQLEISHGLSPAVAQAVPETVSKILEIHQSSTV